MPNPRPNIVFIITDQQRFDTIAELGYDYMETPHLDRLVREGVTFTNCHVTAASCAPSRASLFTGYYPHTTGVLRNADLWRHSWIEDLNATGYRCVNIGKMHSYPYHTNLGFHERYVVENKDRYLEERYYFDEWDKALQARGHIKQQREQYRQQPGYRDALGAFDWNLPEDLHSDMFVGNLATWWIDAYPQTEPLFLEIGFPGPHPPYDPTPEYAERYLNKELPLLPVTQEELDAQPPCLKELRQHNQDVDHDSVVLDLNPTDEQRHRQRAYYLANVTMIDDKVGEIMQALDDKGYLDNSIVIFTSDHGDALTDHGHSQKWTMYDTITRMPLIVWKGKDVDFPGYEPGKRINDLCSQFDIGPAILQLAGVALCPVAGWQSGQVAERGRESGGRSQESSSIEHPASCISSPTSPDPSLTPKQKQSHHPWDPANMEARSLLPAICGDKSWQPREYVFAEQQQDGILTGCEFMTMVRSTDWKLVHFLGSPASDEPQSPDALASGRCQSPDTSHRDHPPLGSAEQPGQLFDLNADPDEVQNLWDSPDPHHQQQKQHLLTVLRQWRMQSSLHTKDLFANHR